MTYVARLRVKNDRRLAKFGSPGTAIGMRRAAAVLAWALGAAAFPAPTERALAVLQPGETSLERDDVRGGGRGGMLGCASGHARACALTWRARVWATALVQLR